MHMEIIIQSNNGLICNNGEISAAVKRHAGGDEKQEIVALCVHQTCCNYLPKVIITIPITYFLEVNVMITITITFSQNKNDYNYNYFQNWQHSLDYC